MRAKPDRKSVMPGALARMGFTHAHINGRWPHVDVACPECGQNGDINTVSGRFTCNACDAVRYDHDALEQAVRDECWQMDIPFVLDLDELSIPPRPWLYGTFALRRFVSVLVAPPGVGKSTISLSIALSAACGVDHVTGEGPVDNEPLRVMVWNNEDDLDEQMRRVLAIRRHYDLDPDMIRRNLAIMSGDDRPLRVTQRTAEGIQPHESVPYLVQALKNSGIDMLIVDPFLETHDANENDNREINQVGQIWRNIARDANVGVIIIHHTGKAEFTNTPGASAGRGASALNGVARNVRTLFGLTKDDCEAMNIPEADRNKYIKMDGSKANLSALDGATYYKRIGVQLENSDWVGVLELVKGPVQEDANTEEDRLLVMNIIADCAESGQHVSTDPRSRARYIGNIMKEHGWTRSRADGCIRHMLGKLMVSEIPIGGGKKGLTVRS